MKTPFPNHITIVSFFFCFPLRSCATHFPDIAPHAIGGLSSLPCLLHWSPSLGDVRWIAYLACNRKLELPAASLGGAERVDAFISQLLLGRENVHLDPSIRPLAARAGGQLLMSIAWLNGAFSTQLAAVCVLLSSAYIGMPQGFLLETLLSDRPSFFGLSTSPSPAADDGLTEDDVRAGNRLLHLKPPHSTIDLEWRVVKSMVALRFVHAHLVDDAVCATAGQSTLRVPALAEYSPAWMDSVNVVEKALPLLQAMPPHASTRLLARIAQVLVMAGDPARNEAFAALVSAVCFSSPALLALAERHVFAPSVAYALALPANPAMEQRFGSSVERTARLWQDALWPIVTANGASAKDAAVMLNALLHGLLAASGAAALQLHPLADATADLARTLAADGLVFLASHAASSVRPLRTDIDSDWPNSALGLLSDMGSALVADKLLALVVFDRLVTVSTTESWPRERASTLASWCARTASALPPGAQRKAYSALSQSLRETQNVSGALPPLSDATLRRALWTQHPPRFRATQTSKGGGAVGGGGAGGGVAGAGGETRSTLTSSAGMSARTPSPAPEYSPRGGRKPPPSKQAPTAAQAEDVSEFLPRRSSVRLGVAAVEAAAACARLATARFRQMDALERQFVRLSQTLFRPVPRITTVTCGDDCRGPAEVSYEVMEQHISATKEPVANREAYLEFSSQFWASVATLSMWSFQLASAAVGVGASISLPDARALMVASVALVAERALPRPDALVVAARAARDMCAAAGALGSSAMLQCLSGFLVGAAKRVAADERGDFLLEQEDVDAQALADGTVTARLTLLLGLVDFELLIARPLAWVRALRMVLAAGPSLSRGETQRLLSAFAIDTTLPQILSAALTTPAPPGADEPQQQHIDDVDDAVALGPAVLLLVGALLAHAERSVAVVKALLERHPLDAVRLCVCVTESWATQTACALRYNTLEAIHEAQSAAPSWSAMWLAPLATARDVREEAVATAILQELRRALMLRRRPQGLAVAARQSLPLLRHGAWVELDACLRHSVGPDALADTAALIAQCAPSAEASFLSWVEWLAAASVSGASLAMATSLLDCFPSWRSLSWNALSRSTICALLRELQSADADSARHKLLLQGVSRLAPFGGADTIESAALVAPDAILPCALLCVAKCIWDDTDVVPVLKAYQWATAAAPVDGEARIPGGVVADLATKQAGFIAGDWVTGRLMRLLEAVRDCALVSSAASRIVAAFWLDECAALCRASPVATLPLVIRVATPLVRHVGADALWGPSASKCFVSMCIAPGNGAEDGDKLRAVLSTFLASITDASHCLLMISVVAQTVSNPIHATPLLEAIMHAYFTCVPFHPTANSTLEVAAQSWVPPSLPEDSRTEFALHDLAACQKTCSALAMTMVLGKSMI